MSMTARKPRMLALGVAMLERLQIGSASFGTRIQMEKGSGFQPTETRLQVANGPRLDLAQSVHD